MWSINVFSKDVDGNYSKDLYNLKYRWSYDVKNIALESFDNIPNSEIKETLCELMEYNLNTKEFICLSQKYSNPFASQYIIPGKYMPDIK